MASTSVDRGTELYPFELPEPLSKARPFESFRSRSNHEGRHESHLDKGKECFPSPPVVQKQLRNLIPHMLDLQRVKTDMKTFVQETARGNHEGRHESQLDEEKECFQSPPVVQKKFRNLIPHMLALQRVKADMKTFLQEEARKYGYGEAKEETAVGVRQHIFVPRELVLDTDKFRQIQFLQYQSFSLDIMLSVLCNQERQEDVQVKVHLQNAIAVAQMLIGDFRKNLAQIKNVDETTAEQIALFQSSLEVAWDNVKKSTTKANLDEEPIPQPYRTEASWMCHALGLEIDFLHRSGLDKLSEHMADHFSIEEWICNFLEENYKTEKQLPEIASLPEKDLLQRIGFRADGDAVNTLIERASTLKEHLHIFDWAEMYVRDEFKYNPVLSGIISSRFPFLSHIREEWLFLPMVKDGGDKLSYREVSVINLESRNSTSHAKMPDGCSSFPQGLEDETHKVLFHGTDHDSARNIFIHGARITHGRKNRDFSSGSGFYLTDDFEHSVEWAFCSTCKPVVLVYRVKRSQLEAFSGLSLVGEHKRNEWTDLVKQYRSGKPSKKLRKFVRDHDYIEGPRASSCDAASPTAKGRSYQMCVISDELAEALDGSLHSAVFYDV